MHRDNAKGNTGCSVYYPDNDTLNYSYVCDLLNHQNDATSRYAVNHKCLSDVYAAYFDMRIYTKNSEGYSLVMDFVLLNFNFIPFSKVSVLSNFYEWTDFK